MLINIHELITKVGLDKIHNVDSVEGLCDFLPAAVCGLADGDFVSLHSPYTGEAAILYDKTAYHDSLVAKAVGRAAVKNGIEPGVIYDFGKFAADFTVQMRTQTKDKPSAIRILPHVVVVDDNPIVLRKPPKIVVEYGACITSRSHLTDQLKFPEQNAKPFVYVPVTTGNFMNQVLIGTYDSLHGDGTAEKMIADRLYVGQEEGVAVATEDMIKAQTTYGARLDIADLILCANTHHMTSHDVKTGITNAATLLSEEGLLVIRGLARPADSVIGIEEMIAMADQAGFNVGEANRYKADLKVFGTPLLSGHFDNGVTETVVLTK